MKAVIPQFSIARLQDFTPFDGVILFSGGLDSTAIGILARRNGLNLLPVYMSHRANVGNVTKKELLKARKLAKSVTGNELIVFKPESKGKTAPWYGNNVVFTDKLPILKDKKHYRNRIFLEVLKEAGLSEGLILLGVFGEGERSVSAGRAKDVSKKGLSSYLKKISSKGKIMTAEDFGGDSREHGKRDLLLAIGRNSSKVPSLHQTESCLMYFAKPCGNCWSCVERAQAFMEAFGKDKTGYRLKTTADKIRKGKN